MPEKYTQFIDGVIQAMPGLLLMTTETEATFKRIILAMAIVAIPSSVVMYAGVEVLKSSMMEIKQEQKEATRERKELYHMFYRHTGDNSRHVIKP
jgi:uncharacterized protein (DUF2062 family)